MGHPNGLEVVAQAQPRFTPFFASNITTRMLAEPAGGVI